METFTCFGTGYSLLNYYISFLVNDQLDAQFFSTYLFQFSTCFEQPRAHHQENKLYQYNLFADTYNTTSCVCHSVSVTVSCAGRKGTQFDIYQRLYWYNWFSWWWARGCSKHVKNWNKYIDKNCASSWSSTKNHNEMHGQKNIKFYYVRLRNYNFYMPKYSQSW
jgi:hypothetical protein